MSPWIYLLIAGIFEIVWATGLKYSEGFTKLGPSAATIVGMIISFYFLAQATRTLPLGTSYAIWTGIGALGTVIIGILVFKEPASWTRMLFLGCLIVGIVGLKLTSGVSTQ
ncbi:Guanidinium exporter [Methanosarcinaceae archaeon Ag5]|uniref:Guanidinium exporter n=1 Tax=Methanolapillus africanus TaxID=3028297 RepID=A0AAE4MIR9_9EURY|nr:Guanidinium exporter [Methanosarcinaceae archaeon Ag5]